MEHLTMRKKLEAWRREKGRTPMKRLSYIREYSSPNGTVVRPGAPRIMKPNPVSKREPSKNTSKHLKENVPPPNSCQKKKLSRREMLEEWLVTHGSTVKKPRSHIDIRKQRRRTIHHVGYPASKEDEDALSRRLALKEQFQRDIDDTVLTMCSEEHVGSDGSGSPSYGSPYHNGHVVDHNMCGPSVSQALDFGDSSPSYDNEPTLSESSWLAGTFTVPYNEELIPRSIDQPVTTPTAPHKKRRRSQMPQVDPTLICRSMVIKYSMALSEPRRKKRRHTSVFTSTTTPDQPKRFLHLTPVRRSTRKNRHQCPGLLLDQELCFNSPSEAHNKEGYEGVTLIPNTTLNISRD